MNSIDLNFLSEGEVEAIVNVIEKDFELKAKEKSRLCRLRRTIIRKDQRAAEQSQVNLAGLNCVICLKTFIFLFNPRRICCSCGLQICRFCCRYIKMFENYVCQICQKQKDLMAMNCSWFYENIKRRFTDGGSQVIANSLSEYPKTNLITPEILNMVKGTQISKFRLQLDEATRSIEESLIKVELSSMENDTKSAKYTELIQMFNEKLRQILRNARQVLYVTMDNYLSKIGRKNTNIDMEVLNTLHEEVELRTGKRIDIRMCQRKLLKGRNTLDDLNPEESLEARLSTPILEKLLYDVQQSLMDTRGKAYEELNPILKSMVKKNKYDSMDFDFESVSQVASRPNNIRPLASITSQAPQSRAVSKRPSTVSVQSTKMYHLSEASKKSQIVSKQWSDFLADDNENIMETLSAAQETMMSASVSLALDDEVPTDSDALSMPTLNQSFESNWLMKARFPLESLNSLVIEPKSSIRISNQKDRIPMKSNSFIKSNKSEIFVNDNATLNDHIDDLYQENISILPNTGNLDNVDGILKKNISVLLDKNNTDIEQEYRLNCNLLNTGTDRQLAPKSEVKTNFTNQPKFSSQRRIIPSSDVSDISRQSSIRPSPASKDIQTKANFTHQTKFSPKHDTIRPNDVIDVSRQGSLRSLSDLQPKTESSIQPIFTHSVKNAPSNQISDVFREGSIESKSMPRDVPSKRETNSFKERNNVSYKPPPDPPLQQLLAPVRNLKIDPAKTDMSNQRSPFVKNNNQLQYQPPVDTQTEQLVSLSATNTVTPKIERLSRPTSIRDRNIRSLNPIIKQQDDVLETPSVTKFLQPKVRIVRAPSDQIKKLSSSELGQANIVGDRASTLPQEVTIRKQSEISVDSKETKKSKPIVPARKSKLIQSSATLPAPEIPKRKSLINNSPVVKTSDNDGNSVSSKGQRETSKLLIGKSIKN